MAQHQHYLNIFEVLRRVTTSVESWEEIEFCDENEGVSGARRGNIANDTVQQRTAGDSEMKHNSAHRISGIPRLQLERPDLMGEHPVTDTEDNEGTIPSGENN